MPKVEVRISNRLAQFACMRAMETYRTPKSMPAIIDVVSRSQEWVSITSYVYDHPGLHSVLLRLLARGQSVRFIQSREYLYTCGFKMAARLLDLLYAGAELRLWKGSDDPYHCCHMKSIVIDGAVAVIGSQNWSQHSEKQCMEVVCITQFLNVVAPLYAVHSRLAVGCEFVTQGDVDALRQRSRGAKVRDIPELHSEEERYSFDIQAIESRVDSNMHMGLRVNENGNHIPISYRRPGESTVAQMNLRQNPGFNPAYPYEDLLNNMRMKGLLHNKRCDHISVDRLSPQELLRWALKYSEDLDCRSRERGIVNPARARQKNYHYTEPEPQADPLPEVPFLTNSRLAFGDGASSDRSLTEIEYMHP